MSKYDVQMDDYFPIYNLVRARLVRRSCDDKVGPTAGPYCTDGGMETRVQLFGAHVLHNWLGHHKSKKGNTVRMEQNFHHALNICLFNHMQYINPCGFLWNLPIYCECEYLTSILSWLKNGRSFRSTRSSISSFMRLFLVKSSPAWFYVTLKRQLLHYATGK